MLTAAGTLLLALGVGSGLLLTLAPLRAVEAQPGPAVWILFPLLTVAGYLLLALPSRTSALPAITRVAGSLLLALGLAAATVLVLVGASIVPASAPPLSLWYVLGFGLVLGTAGLTAHRSASGRP